MLSNTEADVQNFKSARTENRACLLYVMQDSKNIESISRHAAQEG